MMTENIQHNVVGICYMVAGIIGVAGHGSLLAKFVRSPNVQSPSHLLHISLAVSNLGVVAAVPFSGLSDLAGKWLFGPVGCQAYAFEGMTCGIASILTTTALAVERYLHAKRPNLEIAGADLKCALGTFERFLAAFLDTVAKLPNLFEIITVVPSFEQGMFAEKVAGATIKHYTFVVVYIWFKSLFWASMPLLGWARYSLDVSGTSCALDWRNVDDKYVLYILAVSFLAYVLPYAVIVVCLTKARDSQTVERSFSRKKKAVLPNELNEAQLRNITIGQALLSFVAWGPFAVLCLQFLFRDPNLASATSSAFPPLFAKAVTAIMPLMYKSNTSMAKSAMPNGVARAKDVQNDKTK